MVKKIIAFWIMMVMIFSLSSCTFGGYRQVKTNDMIELHTWHFTSGIPNNAIVVKHSEENAAFECTVNKGVLWTYQYPHAKNIILQSDDTAYWTPAEEDSDELIEQAFVDIILKLDDTIIGYAVIEININNYELYEYQARTLISALFPKVNGVYQNITEKYVKTAIGKVK